MLALAGGHPYLLDAFGYHAWEYVKRGGHINADWIGAICGKDVREYLQQLSTILGDGPLLSKVIQVLLGPRWDVTSEDVAGLRELGVLRDEDGVLRGFSRTFEDHVRLVERNIDIWPLWRDTERVLRDVLERLLERSFGSVWPSALIKARPKAQTDNRGMSKEA